MDLWARMEEEEKNAPPQFMSTHPSNHNRLEQIRQWLPEAEAKRDSSECSTMMGYGMCTDIV
jgi:predicted Zn-dependent protease